MDNHLAKPFAPAALLEAVTGAAGRAEPWVSHIRSAPRMPAPEPELPVCDDKAFRSTAEYIAPEVLASYIERIIARSEELLHRLRQPPRNEADARDLVAAAHTLAGSAGMFGYRRLAVHALRYEKAAQASLSDMSIIADLIGAIGISLDEMRGRVFRTGQFPL